MPDIIFRQDTADKTQIADHLKQCDSVFYNDLASRVNIDEYIDKLLLKSLRHEAWIEGKLAGLLAVYQNEEFDFISNVSVTNDFAKLGIGSALLKKCIAEARSREIRLEVSKVNGPAHRFYEKYGFIKFDQSEKTDFLKLVL